jgi:hypothetical protein
MTFTVAGKVLKIGPGESCFVPRGVVHGFNNLKQADAKALAIVTPALIGPDYFKEMAAIVNAGGPPDVEKLKLVMLKHGLVPVMPPNPECRGRSGHAASYKGSTGKRCQSPTSRAMSCSLSSPKPLAVRMVLRHLPTHSERRVKLSAHEKPLSRLSRFQLNHAFVSDSGCDSGERRRPSLG